jgi:hypothetical protein
LLQNDWYLIACLISFVQQLLIKELVKKLCILLLRLCSQPAACKQGASSARTIESRSILMMAIYMSVAMAKSNAYVQGQGKIVTSHIHKTLLKTTTRDQLGAIPGGQQHI